MRIKEIRIGGYKNLLDCRVPLRDFNVLVGPNNAGKSNFLEFPAVLQGLFMYHRITASERERPVLSTIPHLPGGEGTSLAIGLTLEFESKGATWRFNYDACVDRSEDEAECIAFGTETLSGKRTSVTGPAKTYVQREARSLRLLNKELTISPDMSAIMFIMSSGIETGEEGVELRYALGGLMSSTACGAFSISPQEVRRNLGADNADPGLLNRSSDLLSLLDHLKEKEEVFSRFREAVCEIMGFEDITLQTAEIGPPSAEGKAERKKRIRSCFIKQYAQYSPLEEFSDGTLSVVAVVAMVEATAKWLRNYPLLLLEEPENSLHPAAVARLIRYLREHSHRRPVLITTHSPHLLNGVDPEDVIVGVADESGAVHFEKPSNRKAINDLLKRGYMSFGDLLATNFKDVL